MCGKCQALHITHSTRNPVTPILCAHMTQAASAPPRCVLPTVSHSFKHYRFLTLHDASSFCSSTLRVAHNFTQLLTLQFFNTVTQAASAPPRCVLPTVLHSY